MSGPPTTSATGAPPERAGLPGQPEPLFTTEAIAERVKALAADLAADPRLGSDTVALAALSGAFVFAADLLRALAHHGCIWPIDFIGLSSYGETTQSSGSVELTRAPTINVARKPVLLIDDILDSGRTLSFAVDHFKDADASHVVACVLLDKAACRKVPAQADYVGFECPDAFVVGYGMDFAQRYRGLPYVGVLRD